MTIDTLIASFEAEAEKKSAHRRYADAVTNEMKAFVPTVISKIRKLLDYDADEATIIESLDSTIREKWCSVNIWPDTVNVVHTAYIIAVTGCNDLYMNENEHIRKIMFMLRNMYIDGSANKYYIVRHCTINAHE